MFETMILGAGPGGTGALVWAAGAGLLGAWLEHGIAIVDQRSTMGGTLGRYGLNADTLGSTFLECLDGLAGDGNLGALRHDPTVRELDTYRNALPPLFLAGRFLDRLGVALTAEIGQHPRSCFITKTQVLGLRLCHDKTVLAELMDRNGCRRMLHATSAVLALGGRQSIGWLEIELAPGVRLDRWQHKIMPSDRLLARGGAALALEWLSGRDRPPRVVILGGSHSAFSAAWVLLERIPALPFSPGSVQILHRNPLRVFYPSRAQAAADGYAFTEADVCPATGRVHRLGGLRGDGRDVWRRMQGLADGPVEERVAAQPIAALSAEELCNRLDTADLIVVAFGYRLATVPVYAADGSRIRLADHGPAVDATARLRTADGTVLPNVFGVGLGSGFRPWGPMSGEPGFHGQQNSLWLYQHGLGALIYHGVRLWATERGERAGESADEWHLPDPAVLYLPPDVRSPA